MRENSIGREWDSLVRSDSLGVNNDGLKYLGTLTPLAPFGPRAVLRRFAEISPRSRRNGHFVAFASLKKDDFFIFSCNQVAQEENYHHSYKIE